MSQVEIKNKKRDMQHFYDTTSNIYLNAVTQPEISSRNFHKKKKKKNSKTTRHSNNFSLNTIIDGPIESLKRIQSIIDKKQQKLRTNSYNKVSNNMTFNLQSSRGKGIKNPYKIKQKRKKSSGSVTTKRRISSRTTTHA